jgi:hypothetical protein
MQANFTPRKPMHSTDPSEHLYDNAYDFPDASDKYFLLRQIFATILL